MRDELADGAWLRSVGATRPMAAASDEVYALGEWHPDNGGTYPILIRRCPPTRPEPPAKRDYANKGKLVVYVFGAMVMDNPTRFYIQKLIDALVKESR